MELHFISFDFSFLYTSIDNDTVISAFLFLQTQLQIEQTTMQFMMELLIHQELCLLSYRFQTPIPPETRPDYGFI